jgi:tetratricopeptide (TPR) repeat protein
MGKYLRLCVFFYIFAAMKKNLIIVLLTILITFGCENASVLNQINEIESLTDQELFDSAYIKISKINESALCNDDERAHYYLLRTQLGYLTQHPDSTNMLDSLVIPYFSQKNDQKNLTNAYYYKGYSEVRRGNYAKATYFFKKAEEHATIVEEDKLLYKVFESLFAINELTGNYKLELEYAKKTLKIAPRISNKKWMYDALYNTTIAYNRLGQKDSSSYYLNKVEPFLKYVPKEDLPNTLISIAYLYKHTNPEKAKLYLERSLSEKESSYAIANLADIYLNEGKLDEAYHLWEKALTINDRNPKDKILHNILEYDVNHGNIDHVRETVNEIITIKDSIINSLKNDTIKDLQLRFDQEVAIRKQETITNNWQKGLLTAILLITLLVAYIIIKRYREKTKMQETQMLINDLMNQIRELEKSEEDNSIAIQKLNDQIKDQLNREGPLLKQGKILYDQIVDGKTVIEWRKKDFELFINYYKAIDFKTVNRLEKTKRKEKLTPQKMFFLLLNEMGYEKKEITQILGISETSVNTLYFRTKPIE